MRKDLEGSANLGGNFKVNVKYKFFKAFVKFGHVGNNKYLLREIGTCARNKEEAYELMKNMPRCKTHLDDAVVKIKETDKSEYNKLQQQYRHDPFFKCRNQNEIKEFCPDIDKEIRTLKSKKGFSKKDCKAKIRVFHEKFDKLLVKQANKMIRYYL